jgi:phosphoglycolate phosphatase-like HAD superfamily hydrolase
MTLNPAQALMDLKPTRDFLIGIDSDGCAFDSMEIKHKECFIPNIIKHFGLQAVSKYAREAAEFVNLYSKWRGINRFPALAMVLDLLEDRDEVKKRSVNISRMPAMRSWIKRENKPGNPALMKEIEKAEGDEYEELKKVLEWSLAVNASVKDIVHGVPPFPNLRECLENASLRSDMIVVSATPCEALEREWKEHEISGFVSVIAGQEMGKKSEHLKFATDGKYDKEKVLMIGDAPGDMKAAKVNGVSFYPIIPGKEEISWRRFRDEAMKKFFDGNYKGDYEDQLIKDFLNSLPEIPPWKR